MSIIENISGFTRLLQRVFDAAGDVINNVTTFVENPKSYKGLLDQLEDEFCTDAYYNESTSVPAQIIGEPLFAHALAKM